MLKKYLIPCLGAYLLLPGCAAYVQTVSQPVDDKAAVQIAEAAQSVSHSLQDLARIQEAATPPAKGKTLPDPATFGMTEFASVDWAGPIEPLVNKIASASQFKVKVLGKRPAIPVLINISAKNAALADILRDVDFQAGKKADIKVYAARKILELRYNT